MKTYQVTQEFLTKAYEAANETVRKRLKKEFSEAFPKAVEIDMNHRIGSNVKIEDNGGNPFFVGDGVVGPAIFKTRCIVPCDGYTVRLVPNADGNPAYPTLIVFEPIS